MNGRLSSLTRRQFLKMIGVSGLAALPTTGILWRKSSNPVVAENLLPGSKAWNLEKEADDKKMQIKGFASAVSVNKGETIKLYVSVNPSQSYKIDIFRMGYYGGSGGRLVMSLENLSGIKQPNLTLNTTTGLITAPWSTSLELMIPEDWTSGVYLAKLVNAAGYDNYIIFVVRDDNRVADILYQQPVNTYQAYNNFPDDGVFGKSLYSYNSYGANTMAGEKRAVKVSFDRPYDTHGSGSFFSWEVYLVYWLEAAGYDVAYATNVDVHEQGVDLLTRYRIFLSVGHDEYWTKNNYDAAEAARDAGVNEAYFGANAVQWQVRYEPSASNQSNRVVVCYRKAYLDPITDPQLKTVYWFEVGRNQQGLLGIQYATLGLNTPYVVKNSNHWVYEDTGFQDGDAVPGIVGYEVDKYYPEDGLPAYLSYTILSESPFTNSHNETILANSCVYQAPSGAWIFSTGTMSWSWALAREDYVDQRIKQTTVNVLDRMLQDSLPTPTVTATSTATLTGPTMTPTPSLTMTPTAAVTSSPTLTKTAEPPDLLHEHYLPVVRKSPGA